MSNSNYEAVFLIGQAAGADFGAAVDHINEIIAKAGAEVIAMKKWDERRLAYDIKKQKRGVFILAYLSAPSTSLAVIEHECNLSETVLRQLVIRADHLTLEEMQAADARDTLKSEAKLREEAPAT